MSPLSLSRAAWEGGGQSRYYHASAKARSSNHSRAEDGATGKARSLQINRRLHCSCSQNLATMLLRLTSLEARLCFFSGAFCHLQDFPDVAPDLLSTPDSHHSLLHACGSSPSKGGLWFLHVSCPARPGRLCLRWSLCPDHPFRCPLLDTVHSAQKPPPPRSISQHLFPVCSSTGINALLCALRPQDSVDFTSTNVCWASSPTKLGAPGGLNPYFPWLTTAREKLVNYKSDLLQTPLPCSKAFHSSHTTESKSSHWPVRP